MIWKQLVQASGLSEEYVRFRETIRRPDGVQFEIICNSIKRAPSVEVAYSFLMQELSANQRLELLNLAKQREKELKSL